MRAYWLGPFLRSVGAICVALLGIGLAAPMARLITAGSCTDTQVQCAHQADANVHLLSVISTVLVAVFIAVVVILNIYELYSQVKAERALDAARTRREINRVHQDLGLPVIDWEDLPA